MLANWDIELIIKLSILSVGSNDRKLNGKLTAFSVSAGNSKQAFAEF